MKKNGVQKGTLVNDSPVFRTDMMLDGLSSSARCMLLKLPGIQAEGTSRSRLIHFMRF